MIRHGRVVHPRLGVQVAEDETARRLGVEQGVLIVKVLPGSPAEQANLQGTRRDSSGNLHLGDVIVAVDGKPAANAEDLNSALEQHQVGDTVTLSILRDGNRKDIKVSLGSS